MSLLGKISKRVETKRTPSSDALDGSRTSSGSFQAPTAMVPIATTVHNRPVPPNATPEELGTLVTEPLLNPHLDAPPVATQINAALEGSPTSPLNTENQTLGDTDPWSILLPYCTDATVTDIHIDAQGNISVTRGWQTNKTEDTLSQTSMVALRDLLAVQIGELPDPTNTTAIGGIETPLSARAALACRARDGALTSIHLRIPRVPTTLYELIRAKMLPASLASWLTETIASRCVHIAVVGAPASGRTTLAGALVHACPIHERVVVAERWSELAPPTRELTRVQCGSGLKPLSANEGTLRLDWAFKTMPERLVMTDLATPSSTPELGAILGRLLSTTTPAIAEFQAGSCDAIAALLSQIDPPLPILIVETILHDYKPVVYRVGEASRDFGIISLATFDGVFDDRRLWRRESTTIADESSSEIVQLLRERGHELKSGGTLLDRHQPESKQEGE